MIQTIIKQKNFKFSYSDSEENSQSFPKDIHPEYEILLFLHGDKYIIEDKEYQLQPYDLLLIPPTKYHFPKITSSKRYCRYSVLFFSNFTDQSLVDDLFSETKYFHLGKDSDILRIFESFRKFADKPNKKYNELIHKTLLTEILLQIYVLQSQQDSALPTIAKSICAPIVEYINANLTSIQSLDEIAANLFMSKSFLAHQFQKNMGISLMKYIRNKRLLLAHSLINDGNNPTKIYISCGFNNYATFFRAYVLYFGKRPSHK